MKKMKKLFAVLLTLAMVMAMNITPFAGQLEGAKKPTNDDKATATVQNVEAGATVKAYRIVEPSYNDVGFTGFKVVGGVSIANDPANNPAVKSDVAFRPTADEMTKIAADIQKGTLVLTSEDFKTTATEGLATYTAKLGAGYWVVLVTGSDIQEVYNPMLVGVYYSVKGSGDNNIIIGGTVDADTDWELVGDKTYAKSEKPTIDKKITGSKDENGNNNTDATLVDTAKNNGNDVAVGDTVEFEIDTVIPPYSDSYKEVTVKISDSLSKGLVLDENSLKVNVAGGDVQDGEATYSFTKKAADGFEITFASAYALANSGAKVVVTYNAKVTAEAEYNFDPNTNTAKLTYTNDPSGETGEIKDKTYTYTFGIDASLSGKGGSAWEEITKELLKTGEERVIINDKGEEVTVNTLPGAEFTLKNNVTGKVYTTESDENGYLQFLGLDAGSYTLQETKAPEGYSLNDAEIPVVITADYNADGTLKSYSIEVNGEKTSTYTATYDKDEMTTETKVTVIDRTQGDDTYEIKNTKLSELPSTGGIGTTIFTVVGCLIMVAAAGLFFVSRRKAVK